MFLVPPSRLYFEVDMSTPWVAGKTYTVTCIAPDAKPMAEITLYKGESGLQQHQTWQRWLAWHIGTEGTNFSDVLDSGDLHRSQQEYLIIKTQNRIKKMLYEWRVLFFHSLWIAELKRARSVWEEIAWTFEFPFSTNLTIACKVSWMDPKFPVVHKTAAIPPFSVFTSLSLLTPFYTVHSRNRETERELFHCSLLVWFFFFLSAGLFCRSKTHSSLVELYIFVVFGKMSLCLGRIVSSVLIWFRFEDRPERVFVPVAQTVAHSVRTDTYLLYSSVYRCTREQHWCCCFPCTNQHTAFSLFVLLSPIVSFRWSQADRCRVFHHVWLKG